MPTALTKEPVDPEIEWTQEQMANSLTLAMMRSKKPGWGSSHQLIEKYGLDYQDSLRTRQSGLAWTAVDGRSKVVGGLVVQSYRADIRYSQSDLNLLTFVAEHIRQTLTRREHTEELEQRVMERTAKLSQEIFEASALGRNPVRIVQYHSACQPDRQSGTVLSWRCMTLSVACLMPKISISHLWIKSGAPLVSLQG